MRNVALFVVLAVLTIAALVAWNLSTKKTATQQVANAQPTPVTSGTPSPTPETGGALRRIFNGGLFGGGNTTPTPTVTSSFSPTITPLPTVTLGPTPIGGYTKGGVPVSSPTPTPKLTTTPVPTGTLVVTPTPQPSNVVSFTNNGFSPETINVKQGTVVRFVNNASQKMWVVADNSTFNMGMGVDKDGVYEYRFSSTGEWWYHNNLNSNQKGRVVVSQ